MELNQWINFLVALFAITNPIGNLAIFVGLTSEKTQSQQRKLAVQTGIAVIVVLLIVSWVGDYLLTFFGISLAAFQLAGGLIITLLGLSMLQSKKSEMSHSKQEHDAARGKDSIAVVPMTIPIIAGPGAITTVMVTAHKFPHLMDRVYTSLADLIVTAVILVLLFFAGPVSRFLGVSGIKIATRVMGLILVAMAMQMLGEGLSTLFPSWT